MSNKTVCVNAGVFKVWGVRLPRKIISYSWISLTDFDRYLCLNIFDIFIKNRCVYTVHTVQSCISREAHCLWLWNPCSNAYFRWVCPRENREGWTQWATLCLRAESNAMSLIGNPYKKGRDFLFICFWSPSSIVSQSERLSHLGSSPVGICGHCNTAVCESDLRWCWLLQE